MTKEFFIKLLLIAGLVFLSTSVYALPGIPGGNDGSSTCQSCKDNLDTIRQAVTQQVQKQVNSLKVGSIIEWQGKKWLVRDEKKGSLYLCPYHGGDFFKTSQPTGWFYGEGCQWVTTQSLIARKVKRELARRQKAEYENLPWDKLTDENYLNHLTASQFRYLFSKVREAAIMDPSKKHMATYVYMTDFMRRKAVLFARAEQEYILKHPEFDVRKDVGVSSWAYRKVMAVEEARMDASFKQMKDSCGLYFFVSGSCPYCKAQSKIINWFIADYGWTVVSVSNNFCVESYPNCVVKPGLFKVFGVEYTPGIFLVYRDENGKPHIYPVASGLVTYDTLKERIYYYLKKIKGKPDENLLPPRQRAKLLRTAVRIE